MTTSTQTKGSTMSRKLSVSELFSRESERVSKIPHATGKQVNGVSGREYQGFNRINLYLIAKEKGFCNVWFTFDQVKDQNLAVKKGERGIPVFNHKLIDKEDRKEKILSYYLVFNKDQLTVATAENAAEEVEAVEASESETEAF